MRGILGLLVLLCGVTEIGYSQGQRAAVLHVVITQHGIEVQPSTVKAGPVVLFVDNQTPLRGCASNLWAKVAFPFFWAII